jgi:hypothetical protein
MFAGGVAGGAAMDVIITVASSYVEGKFTPYGQIASWKQVAKGKSVDEVVSGVVRVFMASVLDGVAGVAAGVAASVFCGVDGGINVEEIFSCLEAAESIMAKASLKFTDKVARTRGERCERIFSLFSCHGG